MRIKNKTRQLKGKEMRLQLADRKKKKKKKNGKQEKTSKNK